VAQPPIIRFCRCSETCAFYNAAAVKRYELIWNTVRKVPKGRVATYGQIAELAGLEGHARQVGYALHNLPAGSNVPWHRVINARGEISPRSAGDSHELQRMLLEAEGVEIDLRGRIDLKKFRWSVKSRPVKGRPERNSLPR
jgi:methylated-DNA-protein-cysteine methyltransferase related protein